MRLRRSVLALLCVTMLAGIAAAQTAAFPDMLDTTKLPRLPGARELYAFPHTSSFVTSGSVADASEMVAKGLAADGWQEYAAPFSAKVKQPSSEIMTFKRGWQALSVFISLAPAQGGATAVAYTAVAIENDLPFPKNATDIKFAPERPHLNLFTADSLEATLGFFARELGGLGWSPFSAKENAKREPGEIVAEPTQRGALAYFVKDGKPSMALVLQRMNDGRTMVELKAFPLNMMSAGNATANGGIQSSGATIPKSAAQERVELQDLPRLGGARDNGRSTSDRVSYTVTGPLDPTRAAARKLLSDNGWAPYVEPLQERSRHVGDFMRGRQRLHVFFTIPGGRGDITGIDYSLSRLQTAMPLPEGATDIVFDDRRPFLHTVAPGSVDATMEMFRRELVAAGWSAWSAADTARYPNAVIEETVADGARAYFTRESRDRQEPIQVTVRRRADSQIDIEVRVPPFARPQDLGPGSDTYGLPKPERIKSASGRDGQAQRELTATIPAEVPTVLAFYRREMGKRGWKEEPGGTGPTNGDIVLNFSSADGPATLRIGSQYDLTTVQLVHQLPPGLVTAKAKSQRDAQEKFLRQAEEQARGALTAAEGLMAIDQPRVPEQRKTAAAPAQAAAQDLEADAYEGFPVPKSATSKMHTGSKFKTELNATLSADIAAVLAFYRRELTRLNWKEENAVVRADSAVVKYLSPHGPGVLTLGRKDGETTVNVAWRKPAEARKAGVMPKPGTTKIIMGNFTDKAAVITIGKKSITVGAGVGKDAPNGPTLDLAPGQYRYVLKVPGRPAASEDITVKADETWGLIVGPGGALALNIY